MKQRCPICERCLTGDMSGGETHKPERSAALRLEIEPKTRDTWYQPDKKRVRQAPFTVGGDR